MYLISYMIYVVVYTLFKKSRRLTLDPHSEYRDFLFVLQKKKKNNRYFARIPMHLKF